MPINPEIMAEIQKRGILDKNPALKAEFQRRGFMAPKTENTPLESQNYDVSSRSSTQNVPADKQAQGMKELGEQGRIAAAALPVAGAIAFPMAAPEAGFLAGSAIAGVGAAGGEAGRQIVGAATGKPETSSLQAADKILSAGEKGAMAEAGGRTGVKALEYGGKAIKSTGQNLLDYFARVKGSTARTAGELPSKAKTVFSPETIKKYGEHVADAVRSRQTDIGSALDDTKTLYDALHPEGKIDQVAFMSKLNETREKITKAAMSETERGEAMKALRAVKTRFENLSEGKFGLGADDAHQLLKEINNPVQFDATNPGSGAVVDAHLKPIGQYLRKEITKAYPNLDKGLTAYKTLIDDSNAIQEVLGIKGGEKITPERVVEIEKRLQRFLKSDKIASETLSGIADRLGSPEIASQGKELAVAQQLSEHQPTGAHGPNLFGSLASAVEAPAREVLPAAAQALNGIEKAGTAASKGLEQIRPRTLAQALAHGKKK